MRTTTNADAPKVQSDLFVSTAELERRKRPLNLRAEAAAFTEISKVLLDDPHGAVRHLLEIARNLCDAGSAGLSLLRRDQAGQPIVRWETVSGALVGCEGSDTPMDLSPCGLCLETGATILLSRPERVFSCLRGSRPPIAEDLIVPLYDNARTPLGTLWIAHHDGKSGFSSDDVRIVEQLGVLLVLTLRLMEQAEERQHALAVLKSHQMAQQTLLAYDLYQECIKHERAESEYVRALRFKDAMMHEVNHRTKNSLQTAASLLSLQASSTDSPEVREALLASNARLQLLAKAHELLRIDPDNTQTVLMPQLMEALTDALRQSHEPADVRLDCTSDPIALPGNQAISIALLANEAVTNAYKHAFPNQSPGHITMQLHSLPGDSLVLRISDDGAGLHPSGGGEDEEGMGLKLIRIFAEQLDGTLDIASPEDGVGTTITLEIQRPATSVDRCL